MNELMVILLPIVFTASLTPLFKALIEYISTKNTNKIEIKRNTVKAYSPIIRYITDLNFLNKDINDILEYLDSEINLECNYDYFSSKSVRQLNKIKKQCHINKSTANIDTFFDFYFTCNVEYNSAKKAVNMDSDILYSKLEDRWIYRYSFPFIASSFISIFLMALLYFTNVITNETMTILSSVGMFALIILITTHAILLISYFPNKWIAKKEWGKMLLMEDDRKVGVKNVNSPKNNHRKQHKA